MPAQFYTFVFYFSFLFFVLPFTIFNVIVLKTPLLSNIKSFIISSGSMEPKVPTGSIIYTLKEKIYNKGDIIAFVDNNVAVSHRIVGIKELGSEIYYSTKGDANNMEDEDLVSKEAVYGKIIAVIPFVGKFRK